MVEKIVEQEHPALKEARLLGKPQDGITVECPAEGRIVHYVKPEIHFSEMNYDDNVIEGAGVPVDHLKREYLPD